MREQFWDFNAWLAARLQELADRWFEHATRKWHDASRKREAVT